MKSSRMILVVDDEAHIVHVVAMKLRGAGYEVLTARDGEEGLQLAIEHVPDLVITDYQMPLMSGVELARKLKATAATAQAPVLMLTARGFSIADEQVRETNVVEIMSKPFGPREILAKVESMFESGLETAHPQTEGTGQA